MLRWPNAELVDAAVRRWAAQLARTVPEVQRVGYFGSYARGDCGVGSDVDLLVILADPSEPPERRGVGWSRSALPVPADLLIYTLAEWEGLPPTGRFQRTVEREAVWVYPPEAAAGAERAARTEVPS